MSSSNISNSITTPSSNTPVAAPSTTSSSNTPVAAPSTSSISVECNKPLTGQSIYDNTPTLAKIMGLGEKCSTLAQQSFSHGGSAEKIGTNIPFTPGITKTTTWQKNDNINTTNGCGQFLLNSSNILTNAQNINCTCNKSSSNVSVGATSNVKILFDNTWTPEHAAQQAKLQAEAQDAYDKLELVTIPMLLLKNVPKSTTDSLLASAKANVESYNPPSIKLNNTVIKSISNMDIKTVNNLSSALKNEINTNFKNIAGTAATNHIESQTKQPVSNNTRTFINKTVNSKNEAYMNTVQTTLGNTNVAITSGNVITFLSSGEIDFNNTIIDSESVVRSATTALVKNAVDAGITAATQIINDAAAPDAPLDLQGLMKQLSNKPANKSSNMTMTYIAVIIGILFVFGIIYIIKKYYLKNITLKDLNPFKRL